MAAIAIGVLGVAAGCARDARELLDLATTTSVKNAGLLDAILPAYGRATVRVHAAGSGRALEMLADGIVDLVITHAPEAEARSLATHPAWVYRKVAYNRFVVVGPPADPARVAEADDVIDAFQRIASREASFVSRGDQSGTHEREQAFWHAAAAQPPPARLIVSGNSMATTLRHANERDAYTLTDEATFRQLQSALGLVVFDIADSRLLNTYAVVYPAGEARAQAFADWLTRGAGRSGTASYRIGDFVPFTTWPAECPDTRPHDLPCHP